MSSQDSQQALQEMFPRIPGHIIAKVFARNKYNLQNTIEDLITGMFGSYMFYAYLLLFVWYYRCLVLCLFGVIVVFGITVV